MKPNKAPLRICSPFDSEKIALIRHAKKTTASIRQRNWWIHAERRRRIEKSRCAFEADSSATLYRRQNRLFVWLKHPTFPDQQLYIFARDDDFFFGVLHSRFHEVWSLKQGSRLETRPRYTPTTCFETFPFPFPDDLQEPPDNTEAYLDAAKHYKHIVLREEPVPYRVSKSAIRNPKFAMAEHRAAIAAAAKELNELRERWLNPPEWTVENDAGISRHAGRRLGALH